MATFTNPRGDIELSNLWAGTYVDNDHIGPFSVHVTGGTFVDANVPGGAYQMVLATGETDLVQLIGPLAFELDECGEIVVQCEVRVETDASAAAAVFVGLTDQNAAGEIPIEDEDGTLNTPATDAVGFMLEREQDATWQAVSVNADTDGNQTALTDAADIADDVWQHLRLHVFKNKDGNAEAWFYIDGKLLSHTRTSAVSTSVRLAPVVSLDGRAAVVNLQVRNLKAQGGEASLLST